MSILDKVEKKLPEIISGFNDESHEIEKVIPEIRKKLLEEGHIVSFPRKTEPFQGSLVAVDGSRVNAPLSGTDLLITAATLGEGHSTLPAYLDDSLKPEEVWVKGSVHKSNNEDICADVMAALELAVLYKVKADLRIVDGTYLGNVSNVLYPLVDKIDVNRIDTFFRAVEEMEQGQDILNAALLEILFPPEDNSGNIVALPKNDTARMFSKFYLQGYERLAENMPDRIIATKLLHPGEMLLPRVIFSNPTLINKIKVLDIDKYDGEYKDRYKTLIAEKDGLLRRLNNEFTEEGLLFASYFKPYAALKESKAMKIEFPYYTDFKTGQQGLLDFARNKISIIDSDIIDGFILEPWCQYIADVNAKEISAATDLIKNAIIAQSNDSYEMVGLSRGYRT